MRHLGEAVIRTSKGDTARCGVPGLAEWVDPQTGHKTQFDHNDRRGKVSVANPSRAAIVKMFKVAQALRGVFQGDEGEHYDASGNPARLSPCAKWD